MANKIIILSLDIIKIQEGIHIDLEDKTTNTFTKFDNINSKHQIITTDIISVIGGFYIHTTSQILSTDDAII